MIEDLSVVCRAAGCPCSKGGREEDASGLLMDVDGG